MRPGIQTVLYMGREGRTRHKSSSLYHSNEPSLDIVKRSRAIIFLGSLRAECAKGSTLWDSTDYGLINPDWTVYPILFSRTLCHYIINILSWIRQCETYPVVPTYDLKLVDKQFHTSSSCGGMILYTGEDKGNNLLIQQSAIRSHAYMVCWVTFGYKSG